MRTPLDLSGKRFGKLVVIKRVGSNNQGNSMWLCKCDCGKESIVNSQHLKSGQTKSCGCLKSYATATVTRESVELSGAGATFPLPFYNVIFEEFGDVNGDEVAYGGIGSGGGVRNLKDGIVDFCGSDAFLSDEEMLEMPAVVHVPTCMGAVVLASTASTKPITVRRRRILWRSLATPPLCTRA